MDVEDRSENMNLYQPVGDDHVHAVWFVGWHGGDWMATIWEHDGEARNSTRFRCHRDDRVFDSDDTKEWKFGAGPLDEVPAMMTLLNKVMAKLSTEVDVHDFERVDVDGNIHVMIDKLSSRPWCHMKKIETS